MESCISGEMWYDVGSSLETYRERGGATMINSMSPLEVGMAILMVILVIFVLLWGAAKLLNHATKGKSEK